MGGGGGGTKPGRVGGVVASKKEGAESDRTHTAVWGGSQERLCDVVGYLEEIAAAVGHPRAKFGASRRDVVSCMQERLAHDATPINRLTGYRYKAADRLPGTGWAQQKSRLQADVILTIKIMRNEREASTANNKESPRYLPPHHT